MQQVDRVGGVISARALVADEKQLDILTSEKDKDKDKDKDNVARPGGGVCGPGGGGVTSEKLTQQQQQQQQQQQLKCPRCDSSNTKFCYYNNYSLAQPRHFCKNCRRYWTQGGALRNVPVGGGCRKNKRSSPSLHTSGGGTTIGTNNNNNNIGAPSNKHMNVRGGLGLNDPCHHHHHNNNNNIHHQYLYPSFHHDTSVVGPSTTSSILARLSSTFLPQPPAFSSTLPHFPPNDLNLLHYDPTPSTSPLFELNSLLPPLIAHKHPQLHNRPFNLPPNNTINVASHHMNNLLINNSSDNLLGPATYLDPRLSHGSTSLDHTHITYNNNLNPSNLYDHLITPLFDTNIPLPPSLSTNVVPNSATATLTLIEDHELSDFSANVSSSTNINIINPSSANFDMNQERSSLTLVGDQVVSMEKEYNHRDQDSRNIPPLDQKDASENAPLEQLNMGDQKNIPLQLLDHMHDDKNEDRVVNTHVDINELNEDMKDLCDTNGISMVDTQNIPWNISHVNISHDRHTDMFNIHGGGELHQNNTWSNNTR